MAPRTISKSELPLADASVSGLLHWSFCSLHTVTISWVPKFITRLDLGNNYLTQLPPEIGNLTMLEEIWVNNNRNLTSLPDSLEKCLKLTVIDARKTSLKTLPAALGNLSSLITIDIRDISTLKNKVHCAFFDSGESVQERSIQLKEYLSHRFNVKTKKSLLEQKLSETIYRDVSETIEGQKEIRALIKTVFKEFPDLEDISDVIRNCERIFPQNIHTCCVPKIRATFVELRRQNERKKLAAQVELKLRAFYFDKIDPAIVEDIVKSIYSQVKQLEDIQFLIKEASRILPAKVSDITGERVFQAIKLLQITMQQDRLAAMDMLSSALTSVYPHVEPKAIDELVQSVGNFFKKIEDIKKLAADASSHFPAEFETAVQNPKQIRINFLSK